MKKKEDPEPGAGISDDSGSPLRGRTIVITRARAQSDEITSQLEALGARVVHCPAIEAVPPVSWDPVDESIARIEQYDWIVFTSANGADYFLNRFRERASASITALAGSVICAIGPATARTLAAGGVEAQVIAEDSRAEGALKAIIDHAGGTDGLRGVRFLMPRARIAREVLPEGLRLLGAQVDVVETYETVKPDVDGETIIRLFKENPIDVITFTSSSTVSNFAAMVGMSDLSELLANTLVACIGPVTAETAVRHGLKKVIVPEFYNADALVEAIVASCGREIVAQVDCLAILQKL